MRVGIDFLGNPTSAKAAADALERKLASLGTVANEAADELAGVTFKEQQARQAQTIGDRIEAALKDLTRESILTRNAIHSIGYKAGQAAKMRAESKVISEGVENIGDKARRSRRELEALRFNSFLLGKSGTGYSTQSLGALVPGGAKVTGPAFAVAIGSAAAALAPAAAGLTGLLATIPALATAGAGAIATLVLAFHGLGKAIDGDYKAFQKLDPQAKEFVQSIRSVIPWVHSLSHIAGQELYPALNKALHDALSPATLGALEGGIRKMASALGEGAKEWGKFIGSNSFAQTIGPLLSAGAGWMRMFADTTMHLTEALLHLGRAAIPFTNWLTRIANDGARAFDTWIKGAEASGRLAHGLNIMRQELSIAGRFIGALARVLGSLVIALLPVGNLLLGALTQGLNSMAHWIDRNRQLIADITTGALNAFISTLRNLWPIVVALAQALNAVANAVGGWESAFHFILTGILLNELRKIVTTLAVGMIGAFGKVRLAIAEVGVASIALSGPWGILLGTALALVAAWIQLRDVMKQTVGIKYPGANVEHKFSSVDERDEYSHYVDRLRRIAALQDKKKLTAHEKHDLAELRREVRVIEQKYPTFHGFYQQDVNAGSFAPEGPAGKEGVHVPRQEPSSGRHHTEGFPGAAKTAVDLFAKPGTKVLAPENGQITRHSGSAPHTSGAYNINGYSLYFVGESGTIYFMTHLATVAPVGYYKKGAPIATIAGHTQGGAHVHVDWAAPINLAYGASASTSNPFGTPPPFETNTPTIASAASRRSAALAAKRDIGAAERLRAQINQLRPHSVSTTIEGITLSAAVGQSLTKQDLNLKKQIAIWEKQLAADRKFLLTHKNLTTEQVANIRQRDREIAQAISDGKRKLTKEIEDRAAAFKDAWQALTDQALEVFDSQTDAIMKVFDKQTSEYKTPTELLIEKLTNARTERDLQDAVDEAQKNLNDALAGLGANTAQETLDRITEVIGRYALAVAIDKAQAAILGGPTMDFTAQMLKELQTAATGGASGAADPEAIKAAQKRLDDALLDQKLYYLQKTADAERKLYDEERQNERDGLEQQRKDLRTALQRQLGEWGEYWAKVGANATQAYALFDQVWFALTGQHLPPLPGQNVGAGASGNAYVSAAAAAIAGGYTGYVNAPGGNAVPTVTTTGGSSNTTSSSSSTSVSQRNVRSIWDVNSPSTYTATSQAKAGGAGIVITEGDPQAFVKAAAAAESGVPYSVQVNADVNDTPESLAAKVAAAKQKFPGASGIVLDLESKNVRGGPGSPGWDFNAAAAPLVNAAAGNTPITITTEGVSDFNYGAYSSNSTTTFAPQAYWGNMEPRDVQMIVDMLVAAGVPLDRIIPIIGPNQSVGNYAGPVSVYGPPSGGVNNSPVSATAAAISNALNTIAGQTSTSVSSLPASIVQAVIAAVTTQEDPLQSFAGRGGLRMMAEGGILTRPTLMVGGEHGNEGFIPLNDPRAKNLLGGDLAVHVNIADGMEWLAKYIDVRVVQNSRQVGEKIADNADRRRRAGRY